jgi:DNA repair exonuclease SbcCD nuclease subunit
LPHDRPGTILVGEDLAIHGQSYAVADTRTNLALGYPAAVPGRINIGVLHTALEGADDHAPYAPATVGDLLTRGYDYWALGHVHSRRIVHAEPPVVYPGNLQGRHARELGAKGAMVVRAQNGRCVPEFRALDVLRWARVVVDLAGIETLEAAGDALASAIAAEDADGRFLAVRVVLTGATPLHALLATPAAEAWLRQAAAGVAECGLEKIERQTTPPAAAVTADDAVADLAATVDTLGPEARARVLAQASVLFKQLPAQLQQDQSLDPAALLAEAYDRAALALREAG